ncbi:MAG: HEAT repeat domain-containing protein [Sedimentisphaerales bacterium]|nr:HEAT repeat domain-containing protein [Sedimentisphaerales bacterium]
MLVFLIAGTSVRAQEQASDDDQKRALILSYWDELMHYALIAKWDLAEGYGRELINLDPDPEYLLELAESDRYADHYRNLGLMQKNTPLKEVATEILKLVEKGRYLRRTNSEGISSEIQRLSGTTRGRLLALQRLKDSGEWAVPIMIEALRDPARTEEISVIRWAMPQLGKPIVNPLLTVLQKSSDLNVRLIVLDVLGKLGYQYSLPYIQQIIEDDQSIPELKNAAMQAFEKIDRNHNALGLSGAVLFEKLAEEYYDHLPSLKVPADQELASIWFWRDQGGLYVEQVPRDAYDELMTMKCCETSIRLDPQRTDAISLWISAFFRLEAENHSQPEYFGPLHPNAATYALTAGPEYLHRVLARALDNRNRPVALAAIQALQRNSGQQSLLFELNSRSPLIEAMSFPDREVRFSAALTIGGVLPKRNFEYSERVVPILTECLRQKGQYYALVVIEGQEQRNEWLSRLRDSQVFADVISDEFFTVALDQSERVASLDLVILSHDIKQPNLSDTLKIMKQDYRLAFCPTIVLADSNAMVSLRNINEEENPFVEVVGNQTPLADILDRSLEILSRNQARNFDLTLADRYALKASEVLRSLAISGNTILQLKVAEPVLIDALYEDRPQIRNNAIETLGRLDSMEAQRALAALALDETAEMPIRLMAFDNLTFSAKQYGNLLLTEQVDTIYTQIVSSLDVDPELRDLAAQAYGSLNLPSATVSKLILSQSRD